MPKQKSYDTLTMGSEEIQKILYRAKVIAAVGMSRDPSKLAHIIPKYLIDHGYKVIPVNPNANEILGLKSFKSIEEIPKEIKIDVLEVFRPPAEIPSLVEAAHQRGIPVVWLQVGLRSREGAEKAMKYGIIFVENLCIRREHMLMMGIFF